MKTGLVSLVGAGPGDTGLLTLKAHQRISEADLIVYDYLVNPEHLRFAKVSAECLCVGKGFRHKKEPQRRLYERMANQARHGKSVVRLKGGDPYLFGRGGEEASFFYNERIPFEVVPGVTSATACANYAGIPLTHRDHNASVTLLTGHRASDKSLDSIDWRQIARLPGTLVIYMGFYNLPTIARRLVDCGMDRKTPVAVIEWGTLPQQKTVTGDLDSIAKLVSKNKLKPPSLIVIGDVVKMRSRLNWFEKLPLFGKTVWVTRMREKAGVLSDRLRLLGAHVVEIPMIRIEPVRKTKALDAAIRSVNKYDWLIFTSAYGVEAFFKRLEQRFKMDTRILNGVKIACVGNETAKALSSHGVTADLIPKKQEAEGIAEALRKKLGSLRGMSALLLRTSIAPVRLEKALQKMGAVTTRVTAYQTLPDPSGARLIKQSRNAWPDLVVFTSSSAADHFVKIMGRKKACDLSKKAGMISIGPVTSRTLKKYGLRVRKEARVPSVEGLVNLFSEGFKK